jgi:hypothetical protein
MVLHGLLQEWLYLISISNVVQLVQKWHTVLSQVVSCHDKWFLPGLLVH